MTGSFKSWVRHRHGLDDLTPEADKVLPLVAGAGPTGIARRELGHAIDLDRDVLDELLAGLVRAGLLSVTVEGGVPIYRTQAAVIPAATQTATRPKGR
jgi:hypothetical protein